ncbi:TolC family protein [Comamonas sp. NLF-1-9]|uniref:TolC family protein n=1 Tax=Comamonas sp. NLF-1-9 TaxID=2853163 RepID=UPI001C47BB82|nr:TolC family protein [Comamonas sp. NLF-1-9]QXL84567.1 TolC family protein [Comamonas sp. NLF-1-9]
MTIKTIAARACPASVRGRFGLKFWLPLAAALLLAPSAHALTLTQAWQAAEGHDRQLAAARAAAGVAEPQRQQARALWRPQLALTASAGLAASDTKMRGAQFSAPGLGSSSGVDFATSIHGGAATRVALQASQPLYNPARRAEQHQLTLQADRAQLALQAARQSAMLRTASSYLNLAMAQEKLRVLQGQIQAVQSAAQEAQDRFDIGAAPVTAVHEAGAELALIQAQVAGAQADITTRTRELADITGLPPERLAVQLPASASPEPRALDLWQQLAEDTSLVLREQQLQTQLAQAELDKYAAGSRASVDLIAQAAHDRLDGRGDFGAARNTSLNAMVGVQLTIPISTGGMRSGREQEAAARLAAAQQQEDAAREQLARSIEAAWLAMHTGAQQTRALQAALDASRLREDATHTGYETGERTLLDVLRARNDVAATRLQLAQARVGTLLARLQLAERAGQLDTAALQDASAPQP